MSVHKYLTKTRGVQWEVRYRNLEHQPKRERPFDTRGAAQDWERRNVTALRSGTYLDPAAGKITIGELWPRYQETARVAPATMVRYESNWRTRVQQKWAAIPVRSIRTSDIQAWVIAMERAGTGPATIGHALDLLAGILHLAVLDKHIPESPMGPVERPATQQARRNYLDHGQIALLAAAVGKDYAPYGLVVLCLAYTGLRFGELSALRVRDFDRVRRRLEIRDGAVEIQGRRVVGNTKTRKPRSVPVPALIMDALVDQCRGKMPDAWIFTGPHGAPLGANNYRSRPWTVGLAAVRAADATFPRVTPHGLRHAYASLAVSAGANVKVLQRGLGHDRSSTTHDIYVDLLDGDLDTMADSMSAAASAAGVRVVVTGNQGRS